MAEYDGEIRINTKIDGGDFKKVVQGFSSQQMKLDNSIKETTSKLSQLNKEADELAAKQIPTEEYKEIATHMAAAEKEFNGLIEKQDQLIATGKNSGSAWNNLQYKIEEIGNAIRADKIDMDNLVAGGKAFTVGSETKEYSSKTAEIQKMNDKLAVQKKQWEELQAKQKKYFDNVNKSSKKSTGLLKTFATRLKGITLSLLVFNWITKGFNALVKNVKEGFQNIAQYSTEYNKAMSDLKTANSQLKNSFAAAFEPLANIVIPQITKFVESITAATNKVAQFIALLSGKSTWTRATKVQEDYAQSLNDTKKAAEGYLSPIDTINKYQSSGGSGSTQLFEEVPIDSKSIALADKLKERFKELKDLFNDGFADGLGNFQYRFDTIREGLKGIKQSLKDIFNDPEVKEASDGFINSFTYMIGTLSGSLASIGLTIGANVVGGLDKYLSENKERIKGSLADMFNIGTEINELRSGLFTSISYVFEAFASENGIGLTSNIIGIFIDTFLYASEIVERLVRDILQIIIQPFVDNKEKFRKALEDYLGTLEEVTRTIKDTIDNAFDSVIKMYDEHIKPLVDSISSGLSELTSKFLDFWTNNVQPILDKFAEKFDKVMKEYIDPCIEEAVGLIGDLADCIKVIWEEWLQPLIAWIIDNVLPTLVPIFERIGEDFNTVLATVGGVIKGIIEVLRGIIQFITGVFSGDWSKAWEGIKGIFSGIWNTIASIAEGAINLIVNALNSLNFDVPSWVPLIGGSHFGFNINPVSIPRLATGTVVPARMSEFLAVLGDNNKETEVVSPLSTMKQAFKEAMAENGGGSTGTTIIKFMMPDNKMAAQYIIDGGKVIQTSTGSNPFELA